MKKNQFYQELVKPYQEPLMKSLKEFIAIDSTYDEETKDKDNPFGKGVSKALQYIANLAKQDGFIVKIKILQKKKNFLKLYYIAIYSKIQPKV